MNFYLLNLVIPVLMNPAVTMVTSTAVAPGGQLGEELNRASLG